jgi:hypothetical protein
MASAHETLFTIDVEGEPRLLFKVKENLRTTESHYGNLTIPIAHSETFGFPNESRIPIQSQKYSVHPTVQSPDFTMIKLTIELANKVELTTVGMTDAVKKRNGYSLLYMRRCPDLRPQRYRVNRKDAATEKVSIGSFDPTNSCLTHAVYLGHRDEVFPPSSNPRIAIHQKAFHLYRIVVLSGLTALFATRYGELAHSMTYSPERASDPAARKALRTFMAGKSAERQLELFAQGGDWLLMRAILNVIPHIKGPELEFARRWVRLLNQASAEFQRTTLRGLPRVRFVPKD